jgi:CRISPR-associated protein Csx10
VKRFGVKISLLDDAAFTERAGTVGAPKGLDYIPGGALLGVAARQLYSTLPQREAWRVFHSGEVRFGCALPSVNGDPTYPMPLSWHREKNGLHKKDGHVDPDAVWNFSVQDPLASDVQSQQVRGGYVAIDGHLTEIELPLNMMTAINFETERAADGQLFGYQMIPEGTQLISTIEADDTIEDATWSSLKSAFEGEIRLGRSRSALGSACATVLDDPHRLAHGDIKGNDLFLLLLSDLAALTFDGIATVQPRLEWLGLPAGTLDLQRSFMRFRRYSPWNAKRGMCDLERLVISQGSVLVFQFDSPPDASVLPQLERGLGLYRQCGLGRVWANPSILKGVQPVFEAQTAHAASESLPASRKADAKKPDLVLWLEEKTSGGALRGGREKVAETFAIALTEAYKAARSLKALPKPAPIGPSASQWGSVFQVTRDGRGNWPTQLFEGPNAVCKETSKGWKDEVAPSRKFVNWFREHIQGIAPEDWRTLQSIVRRAIDIAGKEPVSQ